MNLLIVAPNWLGDAVMALPAIADVRRGLTDGTITIAARRSIAPLFSLVPDVDRWLELPHSAATLSTFDAALLLPNSFHAAMNVWRARIPERWGYRGDWRRLLLTRAIDRPSRVHQVDFYRHLVSALGFPNGSGEPRVSVGDDVRERGKLALIKAAWDSTTPLVAIAPGAAYGGAKRWPPKFFAELATRLSGDGVATVLVGSDADRPAGAEIERCVQRGTRILNLIGGTDLPTFAGVLAACRALVTNDSGAMHLAAAIRVPVTAIFGPTNEHVTGPRGPSHAILTQPVACRPCMLRECPIDHRCMRGIPVGAVLAEARRSL
jgi:heptosyltransferase-2